MKTTTYILAAIGLLFLGAMVGDLLDAGQGSLQVGLAAPASSLWISPSVGTPVSIFDTPGYTAIAHDAWTRLALAAMGILLLIVLALVALVALKRTLHGNTAHGQDDAIVQELYHLGKNLETRMDALETILFERRHPMKER
jgi:phage shock protein B